MPGALESSHADVRRLQRFVHSRADREAEGLFVIEGPDLIRAALDAKHSIAEVFLCREEATSEILSLVDEIVALQIPLRNVSPRALRQISDARTPQAIGALIPVAPQRTDVLKSGSLVVVAHEVRDPGNAGTIIRSSEAAGAAAVFFTGDSVDPRNPKCLRATAGAYFFIPVFAMQLDECVRVLREWSYDIFATTLRGEKGYREVDFSRPTAVLIGNESAGLSNDAIAACDATITIPMAGRSESLNAGVAASLIAFRALEMRPMAPKDR